MKKLIELSNHRGCAVGDAIHQKRVRAYRSLVERENLSDGSPEAEMNLQEAEALYAGIVAKGSHLGIKQVASLKREQGGLSLSFRGRDGKVERIRDKKELVLKVLIKRKGAYDYVSVTTQMARILANIQNMLIMSTGDLRYINLCRKILKSSISSMTGGHLKPYFSGYVVVDVLCNPIGGGFDLGKVAKVLQENLSGINGDLESCEVMRVYVDPGNYGLTSDMSLYLGEVSRELFRDLWERYEAWDSGDGIEVLKQETRASIKLMVKKTAMKREQFTVYLGQKHDKYVVGIFGRGDINPYLWIKTLYPKVKLTNIYKGSNFVVYGTYRELGKVVGNGVNVGKKGLTEYRAKSCACGGTLYYDMVNLQVGELCPRCYIKKLMGEYVRR